MRLVLAAGTTRTARIDGISAAGADPDLMVHTPGADAEILVEGRPIERPVVPVSPSGCPTPAVVTRAVREVADFDVTVLDAGLSHPTGIETVPLGAEPGNDVRETVAVPDAGRIFEAAREVGAELGDDRVFVAETIPGGTTTALGVLAALGEDWGVSSSLPENPLDLKRRVVDEGLVASDLVSGGAADEPLRAVEAMGDPVLAAVAGTVLGAVESGTEVTLAGGTQLLAAAAVLRGLGVESPLRLATTSFVVGDRTTALDEATDALDLDLVVTDPGFDRSDHVAMARYVAGEGKEGVGMGGALAFARERGVPMAEVRGSVEAVYERLVARPGGRDGP
ncbi:nicotinate mononucleotide-dependent phosphoribosyltransferase CobT [Salinirubellus sp. GCM10025818]|uniref:nicotinate mononucleotide-dependent phosphoribosyltransferase CobT n=1 Tax=Salinirubellus TaxID=2162630 RepID=UPI0030CBDD0A